MKWIAPALAYLAVFLGLFAFHSAWAALLGFHAAILGSLWIARPNIPLSILLKNSNKKWIAVSLLVCGSSGFALFFLWNVFGIASDLPAQVEALGLNAQTWFPFIAYFALVNPFIEEYFWRGYLGNATKSLHISDFLYAGFHALILIHKVPIVSIFFAVAALALAGWFWRHLAREEGGGLLAPALGHMAADFTILVAICKMTT